MRRFYCVGEQINTVIALFTAVGASVSGTTGGMSLDASLGGTIAANATPNNWLSPKDNVLRNIAKAASHEETNG